MTADLPTVPDEVYTAAVKAYCHALPGFPSDSLHDDLSTDAVGFRAALAVAFAAGRDGVLSMLMRQFAPGWADGMVITATNYTEAGARRTVAEMNAPGRPQDHAGPVLLYGRLVSPWLPVAADGEVAP